jgi:hypothetical protein
MRDALGIYLQDHLAGSVQAVELVEFLRDQHQHGDVVAFAAEILIEIKADQQALRALADQLGHGSSGVKELAAWFAEKITRWKLRAEDKDDIGTFEALEFLSLGILGKLALWRALDEVAPLDARLRDIDFKHLAARAETQHAQVEKRRLEAGRLALVKSAP